MKIFRIFSALIICAVLLSLSLFTASASPAHTMELSFVQQDNRLTVSLYIPAPEKLTGIDFCLELFAGDAVISEISVENTDISDLCTDIEAITATDNPDNTDDTQTEESEITENNTESNTEGAEQRSKDDIRFVYKSSNESNILTFSGFFVDSLTADYDFYICNITIDTTAPFTEEDTLAFTYTLTCELCTKTDTVTYSLLHKQTETEKTPSSYQAGDVNLDGSVTANDARTILRASVGLEEIPFEAIPYANTDYDSAISAADARFALRTAVELEKAINHRFEISVPDDRICTDAGSFIFTCSITEISFTMELENGTHIFSETDCYNSGKCIICNSEGLSPTGHNYDDSGICINCKADKTVLEQISADLIPLLEEINHYDTLAYDALSDNKKSDFIKYTQTATRLIKNAASLCSNVIGMEDVRLHLEKAYKLRYDAFVACMDENGDILAGEKNCNTILGAVKLSISHITYASNLHN